MGIDDPGATTADKLPVSLKELVLPDTDVTSSNSQFSPQPLKANNSMAR